MSSKTITRRQFLQVTSAASAGALLAACAPAATPAPTMAPKAAEPTKAPAQPTAAPTKAPEATKPPAVRFAPFGLVHRGWDSRSARARGRVDRAARRGGPAPALAGTRARAPDAQGVTIIRDKRRHLPLPGGSGDKV